MRLDPLTVIQRAPSDEADGLFRPITGVPAVVSYQSLGGEIMRDLILRHTKRLAVAIGVPCAILTVLSATVAGAAAPQATPGTADLAGLQWRHIGPAIMSGRTVAFAVNPDDKQVMYAATASGGAWKTDNNGTTWKPVFEREGSVSVGAIAVVPSNPNIVWVGTGEANSVRSSSYGDGVYKSLDAGKTWRHMGLEGTRHIGRFAIHPTDPDVVYVGGLGSLWGPNPERGLFKTTDGGESWANVLPISDHTGVVDVLMDPRDPEVLFAATFQRERRMWSMVGGGPEGGIYKSTNGGESWEQLSVGLPQGDVGRIGLAVCASQPDTMYATVVAPDGGTFRSLDGGASWELRNADMQSHWYYGHLACDPQDPDRLYVPMTPLYVSEDGGETFHTDLARGGVHGDHHTIWVDPDDSRHLVLGNDGGIYISYDRGLTWQFQGNVSVAQFYTVAVDMREPFYWVHGGTQDNSSWGGPSATRYASGIANEDWIVTSGGDGFYSQIDPTDPEIVYSESQYGVMSRVDLRTGERRRIQPWQPQEGAPGYRWNWSAPLQISPHDHQTLYFAANVVFKSTDRGDSWEVISPDLTRGIDRATLPLQGEVQPPDAIDLHASTAMYGNISSLAVSPAAVSTVAIGTDDGLIQVSRDDGGTWRQSDTFPGVPDMMKVSWVTWSASRGGTLYAAFDGHKDNLFGPFLVKSDDWGETWTNITANLPEFGSSRVVVEHPRNPELLFVGTELGIFASFSGGDDWISLQNNLPTVAVHGIVVHPRENDLVIGTHGRGFWILDDIGILEELTAGNSGSSVLAQPRASMQLHDFTRGRRSLGSSFFTAPNPPRGALISYWLSEEASQSAAVVDILDADGNVVRRLPAGRVGAGVQRLVWDLRHEPPPDPRSRAADRRGLRGFFVMPGEWTVRLTVGQQVHERTLVVEPDMSIDHGEADRRLWHDTLVSQSSMVGVARAAEVTAREIVDQVSEAQRALERRADAPASVVEQARVLADGARQILVELRGAPQSGIAQQETRVPLAALVERLYSTTEAWTGPPTADQARLTRWAYDSLVDLVSNLDRLAQEEMPLLRRALDDAGVVWTPGRAVGASTGLVRPPG